MPNYADAAALLCTWLATVLPTGPDQTFRRWTTELPTNLFAPESLPCVVIERFGGADEHPGLDVARVDVDVYAIGGNPDEARAAVLARGEDIRRALRLSLPGKTVGGVAVSKVAVISAPTIRPFDSRNQIRRCQAAYSLHLHRPI